MHGPYGTDAPGFGNLFVRASQTVPPAELKKKLIELCKQREKPYGIVVRKLDYPSSASFDEFRRATAAMAQSGGGTRPVSLPLLVYKVFPDGHEELVRGLRFRGLSTRSLRDIIAASEDSQVFNFIDSTVPFALMGAGGLCFECSRNCARNFVRGSGVGTHSGRYAEAACCASANIIVLEGF